MLRGACHRARIRATRWLAMTVIDMDSRSRGAIRPRFASNVRPLQTEGAGKTGCALHPRSRVRIAQNKVHTSIQVQRRASGLPCAMALRLISCSPQSGRARCHCRSLEALTSSELDASKRGVRTTRLHRTPLSRSSVATSASTAPRPTTATTADALLSRTGWENICPDLPFG